MIEIGQRYRWVSDSGASVTLAPDMPISCDEVQGIDGLENDIQTSKNAGMDGLSTVSMSLKARNITLTGSIHGAVATYRAQLLQAFSPKYQGTLYFTDVTRQYSIRAVVETAPQFSFEGQTQFFVSLMCPMPYWAAVDGEMHYQLAAWKGGLEFPFSVDDGSGFVLEERQESVIQTIHNGGHVPIGARIIFTASGAVARPEVMHMGTRARTMLDMTMAAGNSYMVDSRPGKRGLYYNNRDGTAIHAPLYLLSGEFITLDIGDNIIRYAAESGADALTIDLIIEPYYMGV